MAHNPRYLRRLLLIAAAAAFIYIQVRLFSTQSSQDAGRVVHAEADQPDLPVAAVVIMACNRPDYLQRTVESILKYQKAVASKFPLFISQDGTNGEVKNKALSYAQITFMQHVDLEPVHTESPGENIAYYKIANHYKRALDELFIKHNFGRVIILEDDMEIAPDFFDYFEAAAKLLDTDKSIMAVSSWNDNGQKQFVYDPKALYRSDFFPGLGWMLTKSTWMELSPKWPKAYWDDWVRLKEVHGGRQFIRPEVCRTYNFGEHGSSMGQFFDQYLKPIKLNNAHIDWNSEDLSYLTEDKFLIKFGKDVANATPVRGSDDLLKAHNLDVDVRIQYNDQSDFERVARQFGVFEEWKLTRAWWSSDTRAVEDEYTLSALTLFVNLGFSLAVPRWEISLLTPCVSLSLLITEIFRYMSAM
ncbi:alpha-1,3-mannosyl-glycoprotein 2-beta-N-acetylglucosaminyltransferase-like isoform X3 [Triticum dicoccoides]|uniref:alpha-1,3-mannosyl-glycoprotein 2-beta-N-acetylglucosaminyltransferase-like isoform X3 n=1 Tax=Triticum dicoccoides TaxID=85692 RepID=UPI00188E9CE2|nr:alpha-1,3-mannosyl-glycoprotein 2-beta-N-acetylglucosaminyltransferase-like isoform X3 [Triticum dicoccoides]